VAHRLYVMRLYRRSLKLAASWYWQRSEYCEKAMIIRSMFDENKNVTNLRHAQELLAHTENLLGIYNHSDPYISPTAPGGSKWERNVP
ncbi:NADH dehydrogenase 1 beta subcomplex subunit 9, partial [Cladochytrium replicatum]